MTIVTGEDEETLQRVVKAYEAIVPAGVFRATSIKVAENTQRNIGSAS